MTSPAASAAPLLEVRDLSIEFETARGVVRAIDGVSFTVRRGEAVSLVGESGCGKSITSLTLMGLLPPNGRVAGGQILYEGRDLLKLPESERRALRGAEIGMIFQDPMSSLNPAFTVGFQLEETLAVHERGLSRAQRRARAVEMLQLVGIPDPAMRLDAYPHQLSGGMSQRVMIAMAVACRPKLLIADEPTTALDVTIQAQILDLMRRLQRERDMGLILITHDLSVVSEVADRVVVMYSGHVVETGPVDDVIRFPAHPYARGLLDSLPAAHDDREHRSRLPSIPGLVPDLRNRPPGCQFNPRCPLVEPRCRDALPPRLADGHGREALCIKPLAPGFA